jgi:hypothetical protein
VVVVGPATAASEVPSPGALTPVPGAPSNGPSATVTCGQLASIDCGRVLSMLAGDHADSLTAAVRIVVDDTCPPTAQCDRANPFEALVVVIPPEGIDAAVSYLATGRDGPERVAAYTDAVPAHVTAQVDRPGAAPEPIPLLNADPPRDPGAEVCLDALMVGRLVPDPVSGLAVQGVDAADAPVVTVTWPSGYTARVDALGLALVDDRGITVAHAGDRLHVGGGFGTDDAWGACGGVTVVEPDVP